MAQQNAQTDEKSTYDDSDMYDKVDINYKELSQSEISKLGAELQALHQYKCKYEVFKDGGSLVFYPSKHLNDENGNWIVNKKEEPRIFFKNGKQLTKKESRKALMQEQREKPKLIPISKPGVFADICATMNCDRVESACIDQDEKFSATKILQFKYTEDARIKHGFIKACELAWSKHYPIVINVNHVWLMILQAVALHVELNAEDLRTKWVKHTGKKTLEVKRNLFVKGKRDNDWAGVIDEFAQKIDTNTVAGSVDLLESNFSNSSAIEKIACKVTTMDILKNYFKYVVRTRCGFPKITLSGTRQDWVKLYNKTKKLLKTKLMPEFGEQWSKSLLPVLARFVWAYDGQIDCLFWNSMIKRGGHLQSGGWEWFSGWINIFFPYIKSKPNEFCVPYETTQDYVKNGLKIAGQGNDVGFYPSGLASAPVIWFYYDLTFKLKFIAGIIGVAQDKDKMNEVSTVVGWVIGEQTDENQQALQGLSQRKANQDDRVMSETQSDIKDDNMQDINHNKNSKKNDNTDDNDESVIVNASTTDVNANDNGNANDSGAKTKTAIER